MNAYTTTLNRLDLAAVSSTAVGDWSARPVGPRTPAIVQSLQLLRRPFAFLADCHQRFGDTFRLRLFGGRNIVLFSHPRAVKQIFQVDPEILQAGRAAAPVMPIMKDGTFLKLDGQAHRQRKKSISRAFAGGDLLEYLRMAQRLTQQAIDPWRNDDRLALDQCVDPLVFDIATHLLFGETTASQLGKFKSSFLNAWRTYSIFHIAFPVLRGKLAWLSRWTRISRLRDRLSKLIADEIRRLDNPHHDPCVDRRDVLAKLTLHSMQEDADLNVETLCDEMVTLLFAMFVGLSTALQHALAWIARSAEVQNKLAAEPALMSREADVAEIIGSAYLDAVCREVLRITPNAPFTLRMAMQDMEIDGYNIRRGELVGPCIYLAHRREEVFDEPGQFRPERFLQRTFSAFEYFPFGGGSRRCIASGLAPALIKTVLATIMQQYSIRLASPVASSMYLDKTSVKPSGHVKLIAESR